MSEDGTCSRRSRRQRFAQILVGLGLASLVAGWTAPLTSYYLGDEWRVVERVGEMPPLVLGTLVLGLGAVAVVFVLAVWRGRRRRVIPSVVGLGPVLIVMVEASKDPSVTVTGGPGLPLTVLGMATASVGFSLVPTRGR